MLITTKSGNSRQNFAKAYAGGAKRLPISAALLASCSETGTPASALIDEDGLKDQLFSVARHDMNPDLYFYFCTINQYKQQQTDIL